jgi:hypothetical protein
MKKYTVTTETTSQYHYIDISNKAAEEIMRDKGLYSIAPTTEISAISFEISQEVFDFIEKTFNIEPDFYGEKVYVCNKIKMKIKEKQ